MHCPSFEPRSHGAVNGRAIQPNYRLQDAPYDAEYREGLENELPVVPMDSIIIALAITIGAVILGLVFWPAIAEFFTPFRRAVGIGWFLGMVSAVCILGVLRGDR